MKNDALDTIVMRKVTGLLGHRVTDLTVWLNKDYGDRTAHQIQAKQSEVDQLREWAEHLDNNDVKAAYLGWIDFYQRGLDEARVEMRTREIFTRHEQSDAEREQKRREVQEYEMSHIVPTPPAVG